MNRKQKIIVSVVGIFIVLLALVGLTYAYFLTQVKGNTNNKSISVTTAYDSEGNVLGTASEIIAESEFDSEGVYFYYHGGNVLNITKTPSYICPENGIVDTNKIGTLTLDEYIYAGNYGDNNFLDDNGGTDTSYFLTLKSFECYYYGPPLQCWDYAFGWNENGAKVDGGSNARITLTLLPNTPIEIGGTGTINNPYIVK